MEKDKKDENEIDLTKQEKAQKNPIKKLCAVLTVVFCALLVGVAALFFALPKSEMSESENRVLAQKPVLTLSSLSDGSFMQNFESWLSDQFPFREKIIAAKTSADLLLGKKEENDVYIGKNGFLFEKQTKYDKKNVEKLCSAMNEFAKSNKSISTAAVISPNSSCILSELLPYGVSEADQSKQLSKIKKQLESVSWIDCLSAFEKEKDQTKLFYRTDHHWTTTAAYYAFCTLMNEWKIDYNDVDFEFNTVSTSFQGTLASSSLVTDSSDEIQICTPTDSKHSYIVYYESSERKTTSLFESEKLNQKNQYEVFLGGNFDKIVITTTADTDRTLLLFKDSYANCMIPMLTPYFSKIVVIDPRYFSGNLSDCLKEYDFTHTAFVYNLNTFLSDTSLPDTLES